MKCLSAVFTIALVAGVSGYVAMTHPATPLTDSWNPAKPLDAAAPVTPLTKFKLRRALSGGACLAALDSDGAQFSTLPDLVTSDQCHIRDRVRLTALGTAKIAGLETRCATALRLALWSRHGLEPAARDAFGSSIARIHHQDSYNCRQIRSPQGSGGRMSLHATANAVDISGVTLEDGRRLTLSQGWGNGDAGEFFRTARDTSCTWFVTTLGPEYNSLHADHFHLQGSGWGLCR